MKKRLLYLILPIVTLILEILPYSAVLNFMRPAATEGVPPGQFRELYSYFDMTPFGYANFAPLFTGIITCIILLLLVIYGSVKSYAQIYIGIWQKFITLGCFGTPWLLFSGQGAKCQGRR
ncbi:MAG: hypothetical protein IJ422_00280 [Oscillospiraceae bacterium]|nr:hypothetical protein [Oscillospiraceae bacterium]